jgi:hypothetical protein
MHTKFWIEDVKTDRPFEDLSQMGRTLLKWILRTYGRRMWAGFIWLQTGTSGGLF